MTTETSISVAAAAVGDIPHQTARADVTPADLARAAWTCSLGSALEYYDFALYSFAAALVFGPVFFPVKDSATALIASFGTYFLGFAVRPLGGLLFGSLGDRWGRKFVLLATVTLMGVATTLIGLLPGFADIGYWAPGLLIALRLLQGLGAGAEQAGAAVLMTEYAPTGRRGFFAALPFLGIMLGTILAAVVYFVVLLGTPDIGHTWLWRVPFLASILILFVAIYMRLHLKESPSFAKLEARQQITDHPFASLLRTSKRTVGIVIGLRMAENGGSSLYQALALSYVVGVVGLPGSFGPLVLIIAALVGSITVVVTGLLTDRFGRVAIYRCFAILQLLLAFPAWWAFSTGNQTLTVVAMCAALGIGVWGMFGTQGAYLPELFGARHRYIGVSTGREVSAVIAGGVAPMLGSAIVAWVAAENGGGAGAGRAAWIPIAAYLAVLTLITIVTTFFAPETRDRDLDDPRDAVSAS
ncbi:MAG: MHS family MFS transporter [Telmatospirillum sp.]|nr:MHS family MFS transporter [Telmatospirillum sp.]